MNNNMHKLDNLEEMEKYLEKQSLPKLNQKESENMIRLITTNFEELIKNSQQTKALDQMALQVNFNKH